MTSEGDAPVRVLYIAGIGRSGSTLLNRALGATEGLFAAGEAMHFFGRGIVRNERCACRTPVGSCPVWGRVAERLRSTGVLDDPAGTERFRHLITEGPGTAGVFLPWQPAEFRRRLGAYQRRLAALYRAVRDVSGARLIVDSSKNLSYARVLQETKAVRVHVVHLVRDSRGVAFSLGKVARRPGTDAESEHLARRGPASGSLLWGLANLLAESVGRRAATYLRVRYQDFVAAPAATLARILDSAGESPIARHIEHVSGHAMELPLQHLIAGNPVRSARGRVPLEEDVAWQAAMSSRKRRLVTAVTFPLLFRYGFVSPNGHHPPPRPTTAPAAPGRSAAPPGPPRATA